MLKNNENILKEVWRNTSFRSSNIITNFFKGGIVTAIIIPGIILSFFGVQAENREIYLKKQVKHAIHNEWKEINGEMYLDKLISVRKFPLVFGKQENVKIVTEIISTHNYQVRARRNRRIEGFYVAENPKKDHKVEVIYYEKIMGREAIRLKSENVKDTRKERGEKLHLRE